MQVITVSHPLVGELLTVLRDKRTPSSEFRRATEAISLFLFQKATETLSTYMIEVETPLEITIGSRLSDPIVLVPILRAGLIMASAIIDFCPNVIVQHIGIRRDEDTLKPLPYYSNLDGKISDSNVFILDPMIATGGTLSYAISEIQLFKPISINVLSIIASPIGIEKVDNAVGKINIPIVMWTAAIDRALNSKGYILPGLGDAGDRLFGTVSSVANDDKF